MSYGKTDTCITTRIEVLIHACRGKNLVQYTNKVIDNLINIIMVIILYVVVQIPSILFRCVRSVSGTQLGVCRAQEKYKDLYTAKRTIAFLFK